jgi:hypothetical protein
VAILASALALTHHRGPGASICSAPCVCRAPPKRRRADWTSQAASLSGRIPNRLKLKWSRRDDEGKFPISVRVLHASSRLAKAVPQWCAGGRLGCALARAASTAAGQAYWGQTKTKMSRSDHLAPGACLGFVRRRSSSPSSCVSSSAF